MTIDRVRLSEAERARGVVIVIDVIRAFTVAAYALAGGAERLWLVKSAEEAFTLKGLYPEVLLAGEIGGRLIPGFDLNNSPACMIEADVRGRTIVQRTGAGTQGAVGATNADHLLLSSLVVATATAAAARTLAEAEHLPIALLPTADANDPLTIEDDLCADYIEALLQNPPSAPGVLEAGLDRLHTSGRLDLFSAEDSDFPAGDAPAVLAVDRFDFAMTGHRRQIDDLCYVEVAGLTEPGS